MSQQLLEIDGQTFVAGLFWQALDGSNKSERNKKLKADAKQFNMDLAVQRTGTTFCVGYGSTENGVKAGVLSAAAVVSKSIEVETGNRDFLFVCELPDTRWFFVAQRTGIILFEEIFASDDAARAKLLEEMQLGDDWPLIIAPSMWGVPNSSERTFGDMIPRKSNGKIKIHKWWRLLPVDPHKSLSLHTTKIIVTCVLIGVGLFGLQYYKKYQQQKAYEEALRLASLEKNSDGVPVPRHPWKDLPLASDLLNACNSALLQIPLFPGNWEITSINCNSTMLTVTWKPGVNGWIDHLQAVVPGVVIALDGSLASKSINLPTLPVGYDEPVVTQNERLIAMHSASQHYGVKFKALPPPPPPVALPGQESALATPNDWAEIGWKAEEIALPEVVLTALEGNGFRMKSMEAKWQRGKFIWTMEGIQYVQP